MATSSFSDGIAAPLPKGFASPFSKQTIKELPTIISCSEHVFPTPADRPAHVHTTGYWFLDEEAGWNPSPELLEFLQKGRRVHELGVGAKLIPRKQLTAGKLAAAIQFALTKDVRDRAKELGAKIQSENGVAVAARIIMECAGL